MSVAIVAATVSLLPIVGIDYVLRRSGVPAGLRVLLLVVWPITLCAIITLFFLTDPPEDFS